ncbi:hypothetical protein CHINAEXTREME_03015 [Halobiforma lacisalsi AJ5]|uniref:Uncharacterized protein n=1 Tax=Natronobacterium lacisalsi AJ5 TaxID=358396 RepID=M0LNK4_NATLA|nr:hypothetical protein [Halobiforma lacisalsi]APW96803.1 hypothetical protein CHINAEXTREME_03015 [Halobiforma lacisalsi AJ5]EMA35076.1 hypothetical protein C445_06255 [Halobiforma lacisalsi AJ5]
MDLETPADAWYVWLAVSLLTLATAGIALGLPTGPPPDATAAANAIERAAGTADANGYVTTTYEHDADAIRIDGKTITMRNDHGTAHASIAYGQVVPVTGHERLENVTSGTPVTEEYATEIAAPNESGVDAFLTDVRAAHEDNAGEWRRADGELRTRAVRTMPSPTVSVTVETADLPGQQTDELEFSYETNREVPLRLGGQGSLGGDVETYEIPDSRSGSVVLDHTDIGDRNTLQFPLTVRVGTSGDTLCDATVEIPQAGERVDVCDHGEGTLGTDVPVEDLGYVDRTSSIPEAYHVTLVST